MLHGWYTRSRNTLTRLERVPPLYFFKRWWHIVELLALPLVIGWRALGMRMQAKNAELQQGVGRPLAAETLCDIVLRKL